MRKMHSRMVDPLGFQQDQKDHKRDYLEPEPRRGAHQHEFLDGPADVVWLADPNFTRSALMLTDAQRRVSFEACHKRIYQTEYASYGRRLGHHILHYGNSRKPEAKKFNDFLRATRKTCYLNHPSPEVNIDALAALGELHVQIVRCLENYVNLRPWIHDLRDVTFESLKVILDSRGVPQTNERNPYESPMPYFPESLRQAWLKQDDPQMARLNELVLGKYTDKVERL